MNTLNNQTEVYLSSKEAGDILGYTHDYISRLCRQGHMVGTQQGREWFVKPSDLEVFKQKHEVILQEKKKQLSQKLSQIRKEHEAQKRAVKNSPQAAIISKNPDVKVTVNEVKSFKRPTALIIPRQLIAACVLGCALLAPTLINKVTSNTSSQISSESVRTPVKSVSATVSNTVSIQAPVHSVFLNSIKSLPFETTNTLSEIGHIQLTVYELQGEMIYESMNDMSQVGAVVLLGYQLVGDSFIVGSQNLIDVYGDWLEPIISMSYKQTALYISNVIGGYQYVSQEFFQTTSDTSLVAQNATNLLLANISKNISEMKNTLSSISSNAQASMNSIFNSAQSAQDDTIEVIKIKQKDL